MQLQPLPLVRRPEPFSHPDWIFEVKYDGFKALARADSAGVRLISRNGNRFASFDPLCQSIAFFLSVKNAVVDGEIACVDEQGCSDFNRLLFRHGEPTFCAFDLLALNGRDLRDQPLIDASAGCATFSPNARNCCSWITSRSARREAIRACVPARSRRDRRQAPAQPLRCRKSQSTVDKDQEPRLFSDDRPR